MSVSHPHPQLDTSSLAVCSRCQRILLQSAAQSHAHVCAVLSQWQPPLLAAPERPAAAAADDYMPPPQPRAPKGGAKGDKPRKERVRAPVAARKAPAPCLKAAAAPPPGSYLVTHAAVSIPLAKQVSRGMIQRQKVAAQRGVLGRLYVAQAAEDARAMSVQA